MEIRTLTVADTDAVLRLRDLAGWNQTERDICRLITLEPEGCFAACVDGQIVGTTTTTTYGIDLAWIGMVLVDPSFRRRGIASLLMERALGYLRERGIQTIKLDATPTGKPVYERFGFVAECMLERWSGLASSFQIEGTTAGAWNDIADLDRASFGTDRSNLMHLLIADASRPIIARTDRGKINGYAMTRPGSRAAYVGPTIANDLITARSLLRAALSSLAGQPVFLDVHLGFHGALDLVQEMGLSRQRELLRMRFGPNDSVGRSPTMLAIAGPEVG